VHSSNPAWRFPCTPVSACRCGLTGLDAVPVRIIPEIRGQLRIGPPEVAWVVAMAGEVIAASISGVSRNEAETHPPTRVVGVEVDQDDGLPGPEGHPSAEDRKDQRGADDGRQHVVGAVAG